MVKITFPDGSVREYAAGTTAYQIAESISPRLAADSLAASVNGATTDMTRPIDADASIKFFKWDDEMHQCIFSTAGMQRCWQIVARETGHYRRMRLLSFDMPGVLEKNIEQHLELISALEKKDVASALKIEGDHIFKLTFESAEIIKANPEYFRRNNNDEIDK